MHPDKRCASPASPSPPGWSNEGLGWAWAWSGWYMCGYEATLDGWMGGGGTTLHCVNEGRPPVWQPRLEPSLPAALFWVVTRERWRWQWQPFSRVATESDSVSVSADSVTCHPFSQFFAAFGAVFSLFFSCFFLQMDVFVLYPLVLASRGISLVFKERELERIRPWA